MVGSKKFVEDDYTYENGYIIEGINILPHLVVKNFGNNKNVKSIFLVDKDADRIRKVVYTSGLWGDADTYSDDLKEKEVEWTLLFSHQIKKEVEKNGLLWIEVKKDKDDLLTVLKALNL